MNILGKTKIYKSTINGKDLYSTTVSNKITDGNYEKMYVNVQFKRGMETEGMINVTNGFVGMYKSNNGFPKMKFVILDYEKLERPTYQENYVDPFLNVTQSDTDLPF